MKIGFTGATGCVDFGDYAMLVNNINHLVDRAPAIEFVIFTYNKANTLAALSGNNVDANYEVFGDALSVMGEAYGNVPNSVLNQDDIASIFEKWQHLFDLCLQGDIPNALKPLAEKLSECDVLVFNGGGYLNKNWLFRVHAFLVIISIAHKVGVPVLMMSQTYGPFDEATLSDVSAAFKHVRKFFCRDRIYSKNTLKSLGVEESRIEYAVDDLFLLSEKLNKSNIEVPEDALFIQLHRQMRDQVPHLINDVAKCILDLHHEGRIKSVVFVVFHHHGDNELSIAREIQEKLGPNLHSEVLGPDWDAGKLISGFVDAKAVLCSRYHPLVISLRKGTPVVNLLAADNTGDYTYYIAKNRGICEYVGAEDSQLCVPTNTDNLIEVAKHRLVEQMNANGALAEERLEEIEEERESVWNSILNFGKNEYD